MKQIHVNAYTKKDGTYVKEHYRMIDTSNCFGINKTNTENVFYLDPVLIGGISNDIGSDNIPQIETPTGGGWKNIGEVVLQTAIMATKVIAKVAPIVAKLEKQGDFSNISKVQNVEFNLNKSIETMENAQKIMKQNLDKNLNKLTNSKNQKDYARLYETYINEKNIYQQTSNSIEKIKYTIKNQDYKSAINELNNYLNMQKYIIDEKNLSLQDDVYSNNNITLWEQFQGNLYQKGDLINLDIGANNLKNAMQNMKIAQNDKNAIVLNNLKSIKDYNLKETIKGCGIPENSKGIIYLYNSEPSIKISKSNAIREFIVNNYNKLANNEIKIANIEFELLKDPDLFVAIQHVTLLNPHIDKYGNFSTIIVDYYDFEPRQYSNGNIPTYINNWGYSMQEKGVIEKYFILIYIDFWVNYSR